MSQSPGNEAVEEGYEFFRDRKLYISWPLFWMHIKQNIVFLACTNRPPNRQKEEALTTCGWSGHHERERERIWRRSKVAYIWWNLGGVQTKNLDLTWFNHGLIIGSAYHVLHVWGFFRGRYASRLGETLLHTQKNINIKSQISMKKYEHLFLISNYKSCAFNLLLYLIVNYYLVL